MTEQRDHGGGLDAACARYGGARAEWIDLSTGINPVPYPVPVISSDAWTALPDTSAMERLVDAARKFWNVPREAMIVPAPGASALIARLPLLLPQGEVFIDRPTYNEHAAAFEFHGWRDTENRAARVHVYVHPNNPDGRQLPEHAPGQRDLTIIDESFCDVCPGRSYVSSTNRPGTVILKSFGKFWGLAGVRLGFAIGHPSHLAPMLDHLGPWPVAGPALEIGAAALADHTWAAETRARLAEDAHRLDKLMLKAGATGVQGTDLFRTYDVDDAAAWQDRLARSHIWSRIFPYSQSWLRLGLPAPGNWARIEAALT